MNNIYVRLMLQDAAGNLRSLLADMESNAEFSEIELSIGLNEVFGSLNTAWNGRNLTEDQALGITEDAYYRLRSFPVDEIIMDGK